MPQKSEKPTKKKPAAKKSAAKKSAAKKKRPPVLKPWKGRCNHKRTDDTYCIRYPMNASGLILCQRDGTIAKRCVKHGGKLEISDRNRKMLWADALGPQLANDVEALVDELTDQDLSKSIGVLEARMITLLTRARESEGQRDSIARLLLELEADVKLAKASVPDEGEDIGKIWDERLAKLRRVQLSEHREDVLWDKAQVVIGKHADLLTKHQKYLRDNKLLASKVKVRRMFQQIRADIREIVTDRKMRDSLDERWRKRVLGGDSGSGGRSAGSGAQRAEA